MKSIGQMIAQLDGLSGTSEINCWEGEFIASVVEKTADGKDTTRLSDKQIDIVQRLYRRHFAG